MTECRVSPSVYKDIVEFYQDVASAELGSYVIGKSVLTLPVVPEPVFVSAFRSATNVVAEEPIVLELKCKCIIVGDLHGHLLDLLRIFKVFGFPPKSKYLFLGDIVDKGEFSTETLTLIVLLKVLYPSFVYIIRGNHEFEEVTRDAGFLAELKDIYPGQIAERMVLSFFEQLPLAALLCGTVLCVHGGIGPSFHSVDDVRQLKRPIINTDNILVQDIVWSDPTTKTQSFCDSTRGSGCFFGEEAFSKFVNDNRIDCMIRGHECVEDGISFLFGNKFIVVFSASNYCGCVANKCGVLLFNPQNKTRIPKIFDPIGYVYRSTASFVTSVNPFAFSVPTQLTRANSLHKSLDCFQMSMPITMQILQPSEPPPSSPLRPRHKQNTEFLKFQPAPPPPIDQIPASKSENSFDLKPKIRCPIKQGRIATPRRKPAALLKLIRHSIG